MERLTKKDSDGEVYTDEYIEEILLTDAETGDCTSIYTGSVIDRLYEYENAEEQGLLLKLPCKVGDMVYSYSEYFGILGYVIKNIGIGVKIEFSAVACSYDECLDEIEFEDDDIGKEVFLTQEAAEQALDKMKEV